MNKIFVGCPTRILYIFLLIFLANSFNEVRAQVIKGSIQQLNIDIASLVESADQSGQSLQSNNELEMRLGGIISRRKELLLKLIKDNPSAFIDSAIPDKTRRALPASLQEETEFNTSATSRLEVIFVDDFNIPEKSYIRYFIYADPVNSGSRIQLKGTKDKSANIQEKIELFPTNPIEMRSGALVRVRGVRLQNVMATDNGAGSNFDVLEDPPPPDSVGNQKTLVLLLKSSENGGEPFTTQKARDLVFNDNFQDFMKEQSYGKVSFSGDVYGWYNLGHDLDCYGNSDYGAFPSPIELEAITKKYSINLSGYDRIVYMTDDYGGGCSGVGKSELSIHGMTYQLSQLILEGMKFFDQPSGWGSQTFPWTNLDYVLSHEMGHSLGLMHANGWDCKNEVVYGDCVHVEYGNPFDTMGSMSLSLHFQGLYKDILGWLKPDEKLIINSPGNYVIAGLESKSGYKYAQIKVPNSDESVYSVERRIGTGFDSNLKTDSLKSNSDGLLIAKIVKDWVPTSRLININASENNYYESIRNPSLNSGQIFEDKGLGIVISQVKGLPNNLLSFNVDYSNPTCIRSNPRISYDSWFSKDISDNQIFQKTFSIYNADSSLCGKSNMEITWKLPESWQIKLSYQNKNNNNEDSNNFLLDSDQRADWLYELTVPTNTKPGEYEVEFKIKNISNNDLKTSESVAKISFIILNPMLISGMSPTSGPAGTKISIKGSGFTNDLKILFGGSSKEIKPVFISSTEIQFVVPPRTPGSYYIQVCSTFTCKDTENFEVIDENYITPSVTSVGAPLLKIYYDNDKEENYIESTYKFLISAGSENQFISDKSLMVYLVNEDGQGTYGRNELEMIPELLSLEYKDGNYILPANKSVALKVKAIFNPRTMFSDTYRGFIEKAILGNYANYNSHTIAGNNFTNDIVVVGEKSPYLTSVSPDNSPADGMLTVSGVRFSTRQSNQVLLDDPYSTCPDEYTCSGHRRYDVISKNGETLQFIPNIDPGSYILQVNHPETGRSNRVWIQISDPTGTTKSSVTPDKEKVRSGEIVTLNYVVPKNAVSTSLMLYCPNGVKASVGKSDDICNQWLALVDYIIAHVDPKAPRQI
jgi:M6 family metalloprotease-like protein